MNKENKKFLVHFLSTQHGLYMYDTNRNCIVLVDLETYKLIKETNSNVDINGDGLSYLFHSGFLSDQRVKEIKHYADETIEYRLKNNLSTLTLQVTQNCNLRCSYCAYTQDDGNVKNHRTHKNRSMSFGMAKRCIDFLYERSKDSKTINIGFYGGEPLLNMELIKQCIEYISDKYTGKKVSYYITTNATLLNPTKCKWLIDNGVNILVSMDGPEEIHNKNRVFPNGQGSYEVIMKNLEKIKTEIPDYYNKISFNMVIDPVVNYSCLRDFACNNSCLQNNRISTGIVNRNFEEREVVFTNSFLTDFMYDYFILYLIMLKRINKEHTPRVVEAYKGVIDEFIGELTLKSKLPDCGHPGGPCIPGPDRFFIDVYGNFYPCERVSEQVGKTTIGNIDNGFDYKKIRYYLNIAQDTAELCKECWCFRFCTICGNKVNDFENFKICDKENICKEVKMNISELMKLYITLKKYGYHVEI